MRNQEEPPSIVRCAPKQIKRTQTHTTSPWIKGRYQETVGFPPTQGCFPGIIPKKFRCQSSEGEKAPTSAPSPMSQPSGCALGTESPALEASVGACSVGSVRLACELMGV